MFAVLGAPINLPASQSKILAGIKIRPVYGSNLAKNILARITNLAIAIARLVVGPAMSERERYNQTVAEARARNLEGLASAWFRPR